MATMAAGGRRLLLTDAYPDYWAGSRPVGRRSEWGREADERPEPQFERVASVSVVIPFT